MRDSQVTITLNKSLTPFPAICTHSPERVFLATMEMAAEFKQEEAQESGNNSGEAVVVAAAEVVVIVDDDDSGDHSEITNVHPTNTTTDKKKKKDNYRIQVSNTKKPFIFYLNLAKKYIRQYNDVELSALGMAIPTVVTIAEILKRDGLANCKEVKISTVDSKENRKGLFTQKAKIQILMGKAENLDKTTTAAATAPKTAADIKA